MPITFNYAAESPPAPYVLVTVARLDGTIVLADLPAKVDSGAAQTIVPTPIVERLALEAAAQRDFEGLGGVRVTLSMFRLYLTIRGCSTLELNVAGSDGEPYILLGRDVLNQFRIVLDGPNGKLQFEWRSRRVDVPGLVAPAVPAEDPLLVAQVPPTCAAVPGFPLRPRCFGVLVREAEHFFPHVAVPTR